MSNNIYTLILNLVISENRLHRQRIALHIAEIIDNNSDDQVALHAVMKSHFISSLMSFVDNPSLRGKSVLFEINKFYQTYFSEEVVGLQLAA